MTTTEQQSGLKPYVVHAVGDAAQTAQTPGMVRQPAVMPDKGDTTKIWMGKVTAAPREKGPPHTHLEAETAALRAPGPGEGIVRQGLRGVHRSRARRLPFRAGPYRPHRGESLRRGNGSHPLPGAGQHRTEPVGRSRLAGCRSPMRARAGGRTEWRRRSARRWACRGINGNLLVHRYWVDALIYQTRRSCEGGNLDEPEFRFLPSQE